MSGDAKDDENCVEDFVVVNAMLLGQTTYDPASLMAGEQPIGVVLVHVDPLVGDDIGARRPGNEVPGIIIDECPIS